MVHIFIIVLVIKLGLINKIFKTQVLEWRYIQKATHSFYLRVDKNTSKGKVIFVGDSHIQGLAVNEVNNQGVNFGIGGDTSKIILTRVKQYQSIQFARAIVFSVGINDFRYRSIDEIINHYKEILDVIPKTTVIIINAVFHIDPLSTSINIDNKDIFLLNQKLESLSQEYSNSIFLNLNAQFTQKNRLLEEYHIGDGIHLNKRGYQVWIKILKKMLDKEIR